MKTGIAGINLLKESEGCVLHAYKDPVTGNLPITIGFGNTYYEDGSKIKLTDKITKKRAEELFLNLLPKYEAIVNKKIKVKLTQNQFDSLVSHTWNTGGSSTLFNLINNEANEYSIRKWFTTKYITANDIPSPGLVARRNKEADLYFKK
jgi:lysozyme